MALAEDTIAALATPVGTSALAVVRTSGPLSLAIAEAALGCTPLPRRAHHGWYRDIAGNVVDDVVITFFKGPHSYTGSDTLEISCHGNPFIAQRIVNDLFARGCRPAEPGEFTKQAFLAGRMDLSQAEAVMDVIHARSERALLSAQQQLNGSLGRWMEELTDRLLKVLAEIEAHIDFPDEDLPPENASRLVAEIDALLREAARMLASQQYGTILREGLRLVIVGEPNAGKSSLMNRLVGRDRALVSSEPGTTRDYLEEVVSMGPHCIRIVDTAGLNPSPAPLEKLGMDKTMERAAGADLLLLVLDATKPVPAFPVALREQLKPGRALVVMNKTDLHPGPLPSLCSDFGLETIPISAITGAGVDLLVTAIVRHSDMFRVEHGEDQIAINARHSRALETAQSCLLEARGKLSAGEPIELITSDLRGALAGFEDIRGRVDNEEMLDRLFAAFCIGK